MACAADSASVATFVPTLLVVGAITIFGINTAEFGRDIKKSWQQTMTANVEGDRK
ncbi:hypothetical protein ACFXJ8_05380 [Nonomuraea sp. NPDC059194]|uniref:hypothetical protein n=1 Tax=Nonomuraea sp. NPDC059194 TaxID=3346764 RepID=UPI0036A71EEC